MNFFVLETESYSLISILPFGLVRQPRWLSGCKFTTVFLFGKLFLKKNSKDFSETKNILYMNFSLEHASCFSGCKCKTSFLITQCFFDYFFSSLKPKKKQYVNELSNSPSKQTLCCFSGCKCNTISQLTNKLFKGFFVEIFSLLKIKQIKILFFL